jgi:DNA-binding GntR family transcriptional regulator
LNYYAFFGVLDIDKSAYLPYLDFCMLKMTTGTRDHVYSRLIEMIGTGEIGPGYRLTTTELAERMGVSRTPIREAISRLQATGMLEEIPNQGAFVAQPSRERLVELYDMRLLLECYAAAEAARNIRAEEIEQLDDVCDRWLLLMRRFRREGSPRMSAEQVRQWIALDEQFHRVLYTASQNQMLFKTLGDLRLMQLLMRSRERGGTTRIDLKRAARSYRHHRSLVKALRSGSPEEASQLMRSQLMDGKATHLAEFDAATANNAPLPPES